MNAAVALAPFLYAKIWILPAAYLLGSIPFGRWLLRARKGIRLVGSGGIDAADVARDAGLAAGLATMLLDAAKGYFSVWLAAHFTQADIRWMTGAALCAILGDMFPIWFGFRGGRGVATAAGAFLGICWTAVALGFSVWLLVLWFWGYVSLASISAAAAFPMLMYLLYAPQHAPPWIVSYGTLLAAALVVLRHRASIRRLLAGTETRFGPGEPKKGKPRR